MCLDKLEKFKVHKNYGWQVFRAETDGKLYQLFIHFYDSKHNRSMYDQTPVIPNQWQKDTNDYKLCTLIFANSYQTGFHIFLRKKDALLYKKEDIIKKVYFKNVVAKGIQRLLSYEVHSTTVAKVIVARERYINS